MTRSAKVRRMRRVAWLLTAVIVLVGLATGGYFFWEFYRVKPLQAQVRVLTPVWSVAEGQASVSPPRGKVLAELEFYHDEIFAFLMFDYLRSREALAGHRVLLIPEEQGPRVAYRVVVETTNNWLNLYGVLEEWKSQGYIRSWLVFVASPEDLRRYEAQTQVFVAAYNRPVKERLESLSPSQLRAFTRRFMLFKSKVDPRLRKQMDPPPPPITAEDADMLAADIIAVANFYELPLDVFLGIAAVENNYMDVRGDLKHGVWKRRAERGDIVLRRARGRVYVLNYATGVWQITRETLRYAHKEYLRDRKKGERDYTTLPERLLPPETLYLDEVNTHWLTLYAGMLLRHLIDYFDGDVVTAVGAYNGGKGRPNKRYEEHVRSAATHARRVLEQVAALHGKHVEESEHVRAN